MYLADKNYDTDVYSGLGRVYLRKNIQKVQNPSTGSWYTTNLLTQSMVSKENTIYIIQYNYSLNYQTITIPEGCVLQFEGGSISNGTLSGNNTIISSQVYNIFNINTTLANSWNIPEIYPEWFGAIGNGITDDTTAMQLAINSGSPKLKLTSNVYLVSNLTCNRSVEIEGNNNMLLFNSDKYMTVDYHINLNSEITQIEQVDQRILKLYNPDSSKYKRGDIVKLYSDDVISGTDFIQSQFFVVSNVYTTFIEVGGYPLFSFTTNPRIQLIDKSKKIKISNLQLSSKEHTIYTDTALITIIGGCNHEIKSCSLVNTNSHGLLFTGCYGYVVDDFDVDYADFINTGSLYKIGIGITDTGSSNFTVSFKNGYTQAFTSIYTYIKSYPETRGCSQFGIIKNAIASGTSLDNHTNAYNLVYVDSIISSSPSGITIRGINCVYDNIEANTYTYGIYAYADSHNISNPLNFTVKNSRVTSLNTGLEILNNNSVPITGVIKDSIISGEIYAAFIRNGSITFKNCIITGKIYLERSATIILDSCTLNGSIESLGIGNSITIVNSSINLNRPLYVRTATTSIDNTVINFAVSTYIDITNGNLSVRGCTLTATASDYIFYTASSSTLKLIDSKLYYNGTSGRARVINIAGGAAVDITANILYDNVSIFNLSTQSKILFLSYITSSSPSSIINNTLSNVYVDSLFTAGANISNIKDDRCVNNIITDTYYVERGDINIDGTLKSKVTII